jgi:imidazolonepropionase-like amidohydrolase
VRLRRREGADLVKFFATGAVISKNNPMRAAGYSPAEIEALVSEAHRQGLKVACHAISTQGIRDAVAGGVDTIEHGSLIDNESIEMMVQKGIYLVPTFSVVKKMLENPDGSLSQQSVQRMQELETARQKAFEMAYRAGVKIACGTDCTGEKPLHPFGENAYELLYMVESGMTPMDAIVAATGHAAQAIGIPDTGVLVAGNRADLIAVDENPLEKMDTLLDVAFVMQQGNVIKNFAGEQARPQAVS